VDRIVITGYGIKTPGANNKREFSELLQSERCALEVLLGGGPNEVDVVVGLVHDDFEWLLGRHYRRFPRISRIAVGSAHDALKMAKWSDFSNTRAAVLMGTSVASAQELEDIASYSNLDDFRRFPFLSAGLANTHSLSSAISAHFGIQGPTLTLGTGCTGANDAFLIGKLLLETGQVDVCVAGGAEAPVNRLSIYGFGKLDTLCFNVPVEKAGIPFSLSQEGFVMSEGAGTVVMERETDAIKRGAFIYGVLDKVAANNDAVSIHQSDDTGISMLRALREAVGDTVPTYVSSQALGLRVNDNNDRISHKMLFGQAVPITSIKGHIGHTMGAAGAVQLIAALLGMEYNFIPATIRTNGEGFAELPIVFTKRDCVVESVAITTHGYGGNNSCLLVSKYRKTGESV